LQQIPHALSPRYAQLQAARNDKGVVQKGSGAAESRAFGALTRCGNGLRQSGRIFFLFVPGAEAPGYCPQPLRG
jgi:hypothetical protein